MLLRTLLFIAALLALVLPVRAQPTPDAAPTETGVVVPNFWDPRARLERPSTAEIGTIRFLTTDDFPPFAFRDRRGILIGFDIDLARAICTVLNVQCAMQARPFGTLIEGLKDDTGNAIIAGFDAERARAADLTATQAYMKIPGRFVTLKESSFTPDPTVQKGFVGVVCGTAHAAYLLRYFPGLNVACYSELSVPIAELRAGRLAAVFGDALGLSFWLHGPESEDCCRFSEGAYIDDRYFGAGLAIVVREEDRTLKFALDYALREVYRSGAYEELYLRYFPVSLF
jgi:polar amino acid transport system substrate-binding protein